MKRVIPLLVILALSGAQSAFGQSATVVDPGIEEGRASDASNPRRWRIFNGARRRFLGDGILPPTITPHGGVACMELPPGDVFSGFDTNLFNATFGIYNDLAYGYGCGPVTFSAYYLIPSNKPILTQVAGLKMEFRRSQTNTSIYDSFEYLPLQGASFADSQWHKLSMTITQADWDYIFNYYNHGNPYPEFPQMVSLLPMRFGSDVFDSGTIYWDDVEYSQNTDANTSPDVKMWDDKNVTATARVNAGVTEPAIPVYIHQVIPQESPNPPLLKDYRIGAGCATLSTYNLIDIADAVPNSGGFPLTFADIVANGYVRPLVQKADGTTGAFGTSVVTGPSFRPNGGALDTVPDMTQATLNATWTVPAQDGPALRASPFNINALGNYSGLASLNCTRSYPDPTVGQSTVDVTYTWTASQNINLPTGRGNDAFRLFWMSSMLSNLASGNYDAKFLAVKDPSNVTKTIALKDSPRGVYIYAAPQPMAVGGSFTLYKDNQAVFNAGGPTVSVQLVSLTGAPGTLGVQGFLDANTSTSADSLSVWLEWTGAPATINAGTVITATFKITATNPTDRGDVNHDGAFTCADVTLLNGLIGATTASANFDAYADMNNDGVINATDRNLLNTLAGGGCAPPPCLGDINSDGVVNTADLTLLLAKFGQNVGVGGQGDVNNDGVVNTNDLTLLLSRFGTTCS